VCHGGQRLAKVDAALLLTTYSVDHQGLRSLLVLNQVNIAVGRKSIILGLVVETYM
jgi:hypothetical protein